jgi:hypothetical protein
VSYQLIFARSFRICPSIKKVNVGMSSKITQQQHLALVRCDLPVLPKTMQDHWLPASACVALPNYGDDAGKKILWKGKRRL